MSRIGYVITPSIADATNFADTQKWTRLGATRFTNEDKQDIRWVKSPGEMVMQSEFPTDVYRDHNWQKLVNQWNDHNPAWITEINRMIYDGAIRFANVIEGEDAQA